MNRSNEEIIASLENAAQISRTTVAANKGGFDVANYLQELADSVRKLDHELVSDEMDAIACFHSNMLVTT